MTAARPGFNARSDGPGLSEASRYHFAPFDAAARHEVSSADPACPDDDTRRLWWRRRRRQHRRAARPGRTRSGGSGRSCAGHLAVGAAGSRQPPAVRSRRAQRAQHHQRAEPAHRYLRPLPARPAGRILGGLQQPARRIRSRGHVTGRRARRDPDVHALPDGREWRRRPLGPRQPRPDADVLGARRAAVRSPGHLRTSGAGELRTGLLGLSRVAGTRPRSAPLVRAREHHARLRRAAEYRGRRRTPTSAFHPAASARPTTRWCC
jgi:hypothetical protein